MLILPQLFGLYHNPVTTLSARVCGRWQDVLMAGLLLESACFVPGRAHHLPIHTAQSQRSLRGAGHQRSTEDAAGSARNAL